MTYKIVTPLLISLLLCAGIVAYIRAERTTPEVRKILATKDLSLQTTLYRELIEKVGLSRAQEMLYHSGLPFDGESHLLNHESGRYAYEKYGSSGILYCKDYFLGSCYHAVILETIAKEGLRGIDHISDCFNKGTPTAIQCAHGAGHGLLAWVGYENLPEALTLCDEISSKNPSFPAFNCHDGVFMENLWAIHSGEPSPLRWIEESDPLFPCDDGRIQESWKMGCWSNQPTLLFQRWNGDIERVAGVCATAGKYTDMCYDGLARQLHPLAEGNIEKATELCGRVTGEKDACLRTISGADFAVGGRSLSFGICTTLEDTEKKLCYEQLFRGIRLLYPSQKERLAQCSFSREETWARVCRERMR